MITAIKKYTFKTVSNGNAMSYIYILKPIITVIENMPFLNNG